MTDVLILGGTGWLSSRIARRMLVDGATVMCLARGGRPSPEGASLVLADRDDPAAYDAVSGRDWDHVIDVSSRAEHVGRAVAALGERAARWTCISSVSVYADDETAGADESAPLHAPAEPGDDEYAAQKVAAENAVRTLGERALIVRPGLIVGEGDPSDRFGYWAAAFLRSQDGPVLVPRSEARHAQVIDIDDLAEFVATTSVTGVVDAVGDPHPLAEVLASFRRAADHRGDTVTVDDERLIENGVAYWAGERSLPLWLPLDMTGFMTRANARYRAAGGGLRPLDETIATVVADEQERGIDRDRRAGLTRADELALLQLRG
ncbi:NAD-dependent epimerase/dehydratase family protein [Microbacterium foliorum]|uniref:NAD dependent epimerase/dehydratase family protein n=1 Tax=Microbacterium foliorum TaxID=104336 RepID=A0A0F0L4U6_9MICO|nr:NAD-dependent epimerase/dehydratase family protein [Microbacterium foliorum]AXL12611.1 NAD-dependent epimerase/dehydratase family protein [Microbacterium foliorum]KJL26566.1 NAD dependent epimerase/dehydratase family protein [Microbacterium foliorum]